MDVVPLLTALGVGPRWGELTKEICFHIFCMTDPEAFHQMIQVCHHWKEVIFSEAFLLLNRPRIEKCFQIFCLGKPTPLWVFPKPSPFHATSYDVLFWLNPHLTSYIDQLFDRSGGGCLGETVYGTSGPNPSWYITIRNGTFWYRLKITPTVLPHGKVSAEWRSRFSIFAAWDQPCAPPEDQTLPTVERARTSLIQRMQTHTDRILFLDVLVEDEPPQFTHSDFRPNEDEAPKPQNEGSEESSESQAEDDVKIEIDESERFVHRIVFSVPLDQPDELIFDQTRPLMEYMLQKAQGIKRATDPTSVHQESRERDRALGNSSTAGDCLLALVLGLVCSLFTPLVFLYWFIEGSLTLLFGSGFTIWERLFGIPLWLLMATLMALAVLFSPISLTIFFFQYGIEGTYHLVFDKWNPFKTYEQEDEGHYD